MDNKNCYTKESLMCDIMRYDFAANELALFLDTHPCDLKALEMHSAVVSKSKILKSMYIKNFGPLSSDDVICNEKWTWIESPWPWEN